MFQTNEYFEGKVKSIAYENEEGSFTIGVMKEGEYEFGTSSNEEMTVVNGELTVLLPKATEWKSYPKGTNFHVEKGVKFKVKTKGTSSYLCRYY